MSSPNGSVWCEHAQPEDRCEICEVMEGTGQINGKYMYRKSEWAKKVQNKVRWYGVRGMLQLLDLAF